MGVDGEMKPEKLTIKDLVKILHKLGCNVNISFRVYKPGPRYNNWALYLRHKRSKK